MSDVEPLKETNLIPKDGIITKDQFKTVAGQDMDVSFTGETTEGIEYSWTYHANQIQNPQDQNLKVDVTKEGLEDIKKQANNVQNKGAENANTGNSDTEEDNSDDETYTDTEEQDNDSDNTDKEEDIPNDVKTEQSTNVCTISIECSTLLKYGCTSKRKA